SPWQGRNWPQCPPCFAAQEPAPRRRRAALFRGASLSLPFGRGSGFRQRLIAFEEEGDAVSVGVEGFALVEAVDGADERVVGVNELLRHGEGGGIDSPSTVSRRSQLRGSSPTLRSGSG